MIQHQAARDNLTLDSLELEMLAYSSDHEADFTDLNERFDKVHNANEYEKKITQLLRRSRKAIFNDSKGEERLKLLQEWREACKGINQGDHYLAIVVNQASKEVDWDGIWNRLIEKDDGSMAFKVRSMIWFYGGIGISVYLIYTYLLKPGVNGFKGKGMGSLFLIGSVAGSYVVVRVLTVIWRWLTSKRSAKDGF
jgi:hypothetical protein